MKAVKKPNKPKNNHLPDLPPDLVEGWVKSCAAQLFFKLHGRPMPRVGDTVKVRVRGWARTGVGRRPRHQVLSGKVVGYEIRWGKREDRKGRLGKEYFTPLVHVHTGPGFGYSVWGVDEFAWGDAKVSAKSPARVSTRVPAKK